MLKENCLCSLLIFSFFQITFCNVEYDGLLNVQLQHDLTQNDVPSFTHRGNISVQSLRLGQSTVNQGPLSSDDRAKIKKLAGNNQFYTLKSIVTANDGTETAFISTIKACMLAESALSDIISISLDYTGKVIAVTIAVASTSTCEGAEVPDEKLQEFTTNVFVRHTTNGPLPDTATYVQKLEREREARERGEVKDNRSFLAKYWMYIVPVVIIMVISSATNTEGGAGGAAR